VARSRDDAPARQGFAAFEEWRDKVLEEEEIDRHKLDRKIVDGGALGPLWRHARRKRNQGRMRALQDLRAARQRARRQPAVATLPACRRRSSRASW
jgi:ATP-binding cassette subfamily F protein uup